MSETLIERLREMVGENPTPANIYARAADALTVAQARIAEVEKERDTARAAINSVQINHAALRKLAARLRQDRNVAQARIERLERGLTEAVAYVSSGLEFCHPGAEVHQIVARWRSVLFPDQEGDGQFAKNANGETGRDPSGEYSSRDGGSD